MSKQFKAELLSLNRVKGLSFSRKLCFVLIAVFGEILRTRTIGTIGLRLVEISLTDRCQCRCGHCFAETKQPLPEKDELTTAEVKTFIDDLAEMWVPEVCFSGGEPLLRHDILELVAHAHRKGLVVRLISNGILLNEKMVVDLKRAGLNWCSVSIDSPKADVHDVLRHYPGCYEKAMQGLNLLIKNNVPCSIITVARKDLIDSGDLEEIVKLGQRLGVTVVRINFPVPMGRFANHENQTLNIEEREKVRELLRYGNVVMEVPSEGVKCTAGVTKANILPNGNVTPCVFVPLFYGNIREQRLSEIWKTMLEYTQQFRAKGQCPACDPSLRARIFSTAQPQDLIAENCGNSEGDRSNPFVK